LIGRQHAPSQESGRVASQTKWLTGQEKQETGSVVTCSAKPRVYQRTHPTGQSTLKGQAMKTVVVGGIGLIGSKLVTKLGEHGHEALDASPKSGVNSLTGEGLSEVLDGADVVGDVSNSPSFETAAVMDLFTTSTRNILAAEGCCWHKPPRRAAGRRDRRPCSPFWRVAFRAHPHPRRGRAPRHDQVRRLAEPADGRCVEGDGDVL
jgi:hypothetical protein